MIRIVFSLLIVLHSVTIPAQTGAMPDKITAIKVTHCFPDLRESVWDIKEHDTTDVIIYHYGNATLYDISYFNDSFDVNWKYAKKRIERVMIVTQNGFKDAYRFKASLPDSGNFVSLDSVTNNIMGWYFHPNIPDVFLPRYITKELKNELDPANEILTKEYALQDKEDSTQKGMVTLKFSDKLKGIDYSLSKRLDSIYNKKLVYARMYVAPKYFPAQQKTLSEFEIVFIVEEKKIDDPLKISSYFKVAANKLNLHGK